MENYLREFPLEYFRKDLFDLHIKIDKPLEPLYERPI